MGTVHNRTRALAVWQQPGRNKESCYVETGTNGSLFYLKYIPKVLDTLKVRRVGNQNNNYNRLLCFRLDKVSQDY